MREITDEERTTIETYLSHTEDMLYAELAPPQRDLFTDLQVAAKAGQQEFERHRQKLYQRICVQEDICTKLGNPELSDKINLIIAIGDIVAASAIGIPPFIVATLIVRMGVRKFCQCGS